MTRGMDCDDRNPVSGTRDFVSRGILFRKRAAIEALPGIVKAVGDRVEVILDGGVRRGAHILKALTLGAREQIQLQFTAIPEE